MNYNFTVGIRVWGGLGSSYVFESRESADTWLKTEFVQLKQEYSDLQYSVCDLPGLKIGDRCNVYGDGNEVYEIIGIKRYSPNRWGFELDNGFSEEVYKCHTEFL